MSIPFCSLYLHLIMTQIIKYIFAFSIFLCTCIYIHIHAHLHSTFRILAYFIFTKTHVSYIQAMLFLLENNISVLTHVQAFANNAN